MKQQNDQPKKRKIDFRCPKCGATEEDGFRVAIDEFKTEYPNSKYGTVLASCCGREFKITLKVVRIQEVDSEN